MKSRNSFQRETILRVLRSTKSHPGADWVYEQVRKEIPRISLGTVYRNLRTLAQNGEIKELDIQECRGRFDGDTRDHYHFKCEKCGNIFDIFEVYDCEIESKVAQKTGYKIKSHHIEFTGLCLQCRDQEEQQAIS